MLKRDAIAHSGGEAPVVDRQWTIYPAQRGN